MTLTSHIVVASAGATLLPANPALGFVLGLVSHYFLDSITHWDYELGSLEYNKVDPLQMRIKKSKAMFLDISKVVLDVLLGFALGFIFISHNPDNIAFATIFAAGIGAVLPDFLQFLYFKWRHEPLTTLKKIHDFFHAKDDFKHHPFLGIAEQLCIIILILAFL